MKTFGFSKEQIESFSDGTVKSIQKATGRSYTWCARIMDFYGIPRKSMEQYYMRGSKYKILTKSFLEERYAITHSWSMIAREVGCSTNAIKRVANQYGLVSLKYKPWPVHTDEEICGLIQALYWDNMQSTTKVAVECNVSCTDVCNILVKFGLGTRNKSDSVKLARGVVWRDDDGNYYCSHCKKYFPITEFTKNGFLCKRCRRASVLSQYGMTIDDFDRMLYRQHGRCIYCNDILDLYHRHAVHVDHEHAEGFEKLPKEDKKKLIRGLACMQCNNMVFVVEDTAFFARVAVYVEKSRNFVIPADTLEETKGMFVGKYNNDGLKWCVTCKQYFPKFMFGNNKQMLNGKLRYDDKLSPFCKTCHRFACTKCTYGISRYQYNKILENQQWRCACCNSPLDLEDPKKSAVDHSSITKRVRGIVCQCCNLAIRLFDNPALLLRAQDIIRPFRGLDFVETNLEDCSRLLIEHSDRPIEFFY